jgi:hypothetical protein
LGTANLWVDANGGSCTRFSPPAAYVDAQACPSLSAAYNAAQNGDFVAITDGTYGRQVIPSGSKTVTFQAAAGVTPTLGTVQVQASNITLKHVLIQRNDDPGAAPTLEVLGSYNTFDEVNVDTKFVLIPPTTGRLGLSLSGNFNTFKNGSVYNVVDEKGVLVAPSGSSYATHNTFDHWDVHDVRVTDSAVHNECVFNEGDYLTWKNSSFYNCATFDMNVTLCCGNPHYGNLTLINNVFEHAYKADGTWHYYSLGVNGAALGTFDNFLIVDNTFETPAATGPGMTGNNYVWANNIGTWDCVSNGVYSHNVGKVCGTTDRAATSYGWMDPAHHNFHLTPGSPAIDEANSAYGPNLDKDGIQRPVGPQPDAGPYEYH